MFSLLRGVSKEDFECNRDMMRLDGFRADQMPAYECVLRRVLFVLCARHLIPSPRFRIIATHLI